MWYYGAAGTVELIRGGRSIEPRRWAVKSVNVPLTSEDLAELLETLGDELETTKSADQRRACGSRIDLFIRLQAAAEGLGQGVWADAELPSWALEQLRRAAVTARTVGELQEKAKQLEQQVNSLRQKAAAAKRTKKAAPAPAGKARPAGAVSSAAPSGTPIPPATPPSSAPAADASRGSSSAPAPSRRSTAIVGDGGA